MNWKPIEELAHYQNVLLHMPIKKHKIIIGFKSDLGVIIDDSTRMPVRFQPSHFCELPDRPDFYLY